MHLLLWIIFMLDFISMGFAELWGNGKEAQIEKENIIYVSSWIRTSNLSAQQAAP